MSTDPREFERPIDGSDTLTPPLVDVIAEVLLRELGSPLWVAENEGMLDDPISAANSAARAVLDALTKAGGVEWGVRYEWTNDQGHPESDVAIKRTEAHARRESEFEGSLSTIGNIPGPRISMVSRITGPWTAAEG